jgi:5-formyltetrahydrofolate cyclo-ligase
MPSDIQIEAEKQVMRARMRAARNAVTSEDRARAAADVAELGLGFLGRERGIVAAYHPVRSEFDCLPLLRKLEGDGWQLALPVILGAEPLEFRPWRFGATLKPGPFGIPEPPEGDAVIPQIVIVPLLAFDARLYRLGYGGGHYDRTLAALRRQGSVTAVGLAFTVQEVTEVPVGPYDMRLDHILTPSGPISPKD